MPCVCTAHKRSLADMDSHRLETTVQKLEQDFQQIQATFQLNQEKLEYNYLILFEKVSCMACLRAA